MISKAASYAVQSLAYLTLAGEDREYVPISEISRELDIPYHFLKKIIADLVIGGLLVSHRSAKGGIALAKRPQQISVMDIIARVDGTDVFERCILSLPGCGQEKPCALHERWAVERSRLFDMFSKATLASIATKVSDLGLRIKP